MINPILMAAARGAMIEARFSTHSPWWTVATIDITNHAAEEYRIHPDDEHLKYGPISTVLREAASTADQNETLTLPAGRGIWWPSACDYREYLDCEDELHRSLFLLILAEEMVDEGL